MNRPAREIENVARAFIELLGADRVSFDVDSRRHASRSMSYEPGRIPLGIVSPIGTAEVCEIVRLAGTLGVGLHAISRGRNWGYGEANAAAPGQLIVDLGRMNRILEIDDELGFVVLEAGVTQGQLFEALESRDLALQSDSTGAGPDTSIVGNILERGFGHTRYGNRFEHIGGMKVVLADGAVLETDLRSRVHRHGIGPSLDGIFSQSSLGIVTEMTVLLQPKPRHARAFFIGTKDEAAAGDMIDRLRRLRLDGTLSSTVHVANDLRLISSRRSYPWEANSNRSPLALDVRRRLREEDGIPAWGASGVLTGSPQMNRAAAAAVKAAFRRPYELHFVDEAKLRRIEKLCAAAQWMGIRLPISQRIGLIRGHFDLLNGKPVAHALRGAAWRARSGSRGFDGSDPAASDAGLLWISPMLPALGRSAMRVVTSLESIFAGHGFDLPITFTFVSPRALCCIANLAFDRNYPDEMDAAARCYDEAWRALLAAGHFPHRAGIELAAQLSTVDPVRSSVVDRLKRALDPADIIAPGRSEHHRFDRRP